MPAPADKNAARDAARAARKAIDPALAVEAAFALRDLLLALPVLQDARFVLAYGASAEELGLEPTAQALRERGVRVVYPRIIDAGALELHLVSDESDLVRGAFGILEPSPEAPVVAPDSIDVVLVPGVGFDAHGFRVGYGGGYYDRLLPLLENAVRVGIAFDEQLLAKPLHREEHDEPVDVIVTPTQVIPAE